MARASPYFAELRKNESKHRNFKRFSKDLGNEPKHLYEDIIKEKNWVGASLLFEALNGRAPAATCLDLIDRYPEACVAKDANGTRPISVALRVQTPLPVVRAIMDNTPHKAMKGDAPGKLLLVGLRFHCPDDVLIWWIERFPKSATYRGGRLRYFPLLVALEFRKSAVAVKALLEQFPDACRHPDVAGRLPLHYAIETRAPLGVVELLAGAYPRALDLPAHVCQPTKGCKTTELPLPLDDADDQEEGAAASPAPAAQIESSADAPWDKRGTEIRAGGGSAPPSRAPSRPPSRPSSRGPSQSAMPKDPDRCLHLGLRAGAADDVIMFLLAKSSSAPKCLSKRDSNGWFPLHTALALGVCGVELLVALLRGAPSGSGEGFDPVLARTTDGKTTFVLALEAAAPEPFLLECLTCCPAAAVATSPEGLFPLMVALRRVPDHLTFLGELQGAAPAVPSLVVRQRSIRPPQRPPPEPPDDPKALPPIEDTRRRDILKRHSAAGYVVPAAAARAAEATSSTTALHECLRWGHEGAVALGLIRQSPVTHLSLVSGDERHIPLHLALMNRNLTDREDVVVRLVEVRSLNLLQGNLFFRHHPPIFNMHVDIVRFFLLLLRVLSFIQMGLGR